MLLLSNARHFDERNTLQKCKIYLSEWLCYRVKYIIDGGKLMDKAMLYLCSQITYTTCSFDWDIISGCFYEDSDAIFVLINIKDSPISTCGAIESTTHFYYILIKIVRLDNN